MPRRLRPRLLPLRSWCTRPTTTLGPNQSLRVSGKREMMVMAEGRPRDPRLVVFFLTSFFAQSLTGPAVRRSPFLRDFPYHPYHPPSRSTPVTVYEPIPRFSIVRRDCITVSFCSLCLSFRSLFLYFRSLCLLSFALSVSVCFVFPSVRIVFPSVRCVCFRSLCLSFFRFVPFRSLCLNFIVGTCPPENNVKRPSL
jgi:hypothetical protein